MLPRPLRSPLAARLLAALLLLVLPTLPTLPPFAAWLSQMWSLLPGHGGGSQHGGQSQLGQLSQRSQHGDRGGRSQGSRPTVRVPAGLGIGSSVILDPNGGGPSSGGSGSAPPAPGPH